MEQVLLSVSRRGHNRSNVIQKGEEDLRRYVVGR